MSMITVHRSPSGEEVVINTAQIETVANYRGPFSLRTRIYMVGGERIETRESRAEIHTMVKAADSIASHERERCLSIIRARIDRLESAMCERTQRHCSSLDTLRELYREIAGEGT